MCFDFWGLLVDSLDSGFERKMSSTICYVKIKTFLCKELEFQWAATCMYLLSSMNAVSIIITENQEKREKSTYEPPHVDQSQGRTNSRASLAQYGKNDSRFSDKFREINFSLRSWFELFSRNIFQVSCFLFFFHIVLVWRSLPVNVCCIMKITESIF